MAKEKALKVEVEPTASLVPYANNANIHTEEQIEQIAASIREFGFNDPIAVWTNPDGKSEIIEGHGRVMAAQKLGLEELPVIHLDALTDEQRRAYTHVHNQLTRNSEWDWEMLADDMAELDFDWEELGFQSVALDDWSGGESSLSEGEESGSGVIAGKFGIVPYSVIRTTDANWAERKRRWIAMGLRSEKGRGGGLAFNIRNFGKDEKL